MSYREELEEKVAYQDTGLSVGCGCMIWIVGIFGTAGLMLVIGIYLFDGGNLFASSPTFWESVGRWVFVFSPQTIFIVTCLIIRWRRAVRNRNIGVCSQCGYDLRATPNPRGPFFPTCPECGGKSPTPPIGA